MATIVPFWKRFGVMASAFAIAVLAVGCKGETTLSEVEQTEGFDVSMEMDPLTLNPPQLGSLTFDVTDNATGKQVREFEPIFGSNILMHNILVREDLEYFRHDTASFVVDGQISVPAYFPTTGSYKAFALYKPLAGAVQHFTGRIVSGEETHGANMRETTLGSQIVGSLRVDWVKGTEVVMAGRPQQLAFFVSERGQPISALWPLYGAPAHLWVLDSEAHELAHAVGRSESRRLIPEATVTPGPPRTPTARGTGTPRRAGTPSPEAGTSSGLGSSSDPVERENPAGVITDTTPPTLVPDLRAAFATLTAGPRATLPPVQQTAMAPVLDTPAVPPVIGYGPIVVFEHTFPQPGLYKVWLELQYRDEVITTDWVIRVVR